MVLTVCSFSCHVPGSRVQTGGFRYQDLVPKPRDRPDEKTRTGPGRSREVSETRREEVTKTKVLVPCALPVPVRVPTPVGDLFT